MACKYFIAGNWVEPFQLKKMLAEGLLDQLIENENLLVPETENGYTFEINEEVLEQLAPTTIGVSEVKLRIAHKANASKNTNTQKQIEEDGSISPLRKEKNINKVLEETNKQIEKENQKGKVKREKIKFLLATKIGGKVQFPNIAKEVRAKLTKELADLGANMTEGTMYLVVPSSYGYSIVPVKTSFIGQTKKAEALKKDLKTIFESKDQKEINAAIANIKKYVHKFDISVKDGVVKTTHGILKSGKANNEIKTWKNIEELSEYIFGKFDKKGNYTGEIVNNKRTQTGILAKVPIKQDGKVVLNSPGFNEELANNNFITTDLYSENGNFFHSSSFVIRALSINAETQKELNEAFEDNKELFDALEAAYKQSRTGKPNSSKSDESPAYNMTIEDFEAVREITFEDQRGSKITVTSEMQNGKLTIVNIDKGNSKLYDKTIRKAFFKRPEVVEFLKKLTKVDNKKQTTLDKIGKIQTESQAFEVVTNEESESYYEGKELELQRQTDANARLTGNEKTPNEAMRRGASVGNFLDILGRDILVGKIQTREEFIAAANEANKENGYTIDITQEAFESIVQEFIELRENLKEQGFTLVTSGMFVYENYNEATQTKTGFDGIGGMMDLVAVDKDGNVHIIDFKNMRYNEKFHDKNLYETSEYTDKETRETKTITARVEDWANQQTIYGALGILPKYGLPVVSINALPISTTYDIADLDEDRQVILLNEATFSNNKSEIKEDFASKMSPSIIQLKSNKGLSDNLKKELSPEEGSKSLDALIQETEEQQQEPTSPPVDPGLIAAMSQITETEETNPKDSEISESSESSLEDSRENAGNALDFLNQNKVKGKSTGTDPGMDEAMRERSLSNKEDGTLMNLEEELAWVKKTLGEKVIGTVFNSLEDLQKYLPEETYEMLLRARKQGRVLHGIFTGAAMHLARNGFAGTGYHEAFHVVFNLALSDTQKLDLLKEAREKYADELSENPTLIEIEELLADKFMAYMQANEANAKSLPTKIGRFFKALFRKLKLFFSPNSKVSIDEIFENISLGVYKNRISFENTDLTKIGNNGIRFSLDQLRDSNGPAEITYENPAEEREALEYLEDKLNRILEDFRNTVGKDGVPLKKLSDAELINKIGGPKALMHHIVVALKADIETYQGTKGAARLNKLLDILIQPQIKNSDGSLKYVAIEEVELATSKQGQFGFEKSNLILFKQPTKLITQFSRWLRKNGLRLNLDTVKETSFEPTEQEKINENPEEQSMEEAWGNNHATIDPRSRLSQRLKRTLNTLEQQDSNGAIKKNSLGANKTYSGSEVFGYLSGTEVDPSTQEIKPRLTDAYSVEEMMDRLRKMKNKKPFISALLSRLEDSAEGAELKKDLFLALGGKTFQHFLHVHIKNGIFQTFFSNRKSVNTIIQDNIIGEFHVEANPLFKKSREKLGKGNLTNEINVGKATEALLEIRRLSEKVKTGHNLSATGGNTVEAREELFKEISELLNKYFIRVSPAEITQIWSPERKDVRGSWQNIINLVESVESIFQDLSEGENPFAYQRPVAKNVQTKRGVITVHQSKVSTLASILKPALEKEVVSSSKNVENKSVYAVQYANFLKKKFQELKDPIKIQEFLNQIANDPVMSNMPLLEELLNDESLRQDLHAGVLDGLTRRGKRRGVKYAKMSDAEITSVDLALWNNQSRYKLPIPSDSGTIAYIKLRKYSKEEIIQNLVKVAKGEIGRIQLLNDKERSKELRKITNYYKRGTKFQILSFLNDKLDLNNIPQDLDLTLTKLIEDFINNEFYKKEIQSFKDKGIIISESENGTLQFKEDVIDKTYAAKATENFKDYLLNQFYVNTQISTIFGGDPSFYKNTTDFQKRFKQVLSPGQYTIEGSINPTYNAIILNDNIIKESKENIDNAVEFIKNSDLSENKKKEIIALWKSAAHNETDGATFISLDRYIDILTSLNRYTDKHKKAAKRIRDGIEHPEDIALFPPIKPFLYTQRKVGDILVPLQVKNSEVLLTKNLASKHPKLQAVWEVMNNPETLAGKTELGVVDSVIFESAVKVGGVGQSVDSKGKVRFNDFVEQPDGSFALNTENPHIVTINHEDWKLQQETPNHAIDEIGNYGSQIRHLAIADLDLESDEIVFDGKTAKEIAKEYQELIIENLKSSFQEIESLFLDEDGEINYERLVAELEQEMTDRDMEQDYFDAIELVDIMVDGQKTGKKKTALPLWHPLISYKVESLLNSFFANRVTKQKINGGNMVNATSYGVSDNLKFEIQKNGTIYMEALLPAWSKKFFPKDSNGEISEEMFERIEKEAPELLNIIGYRIPTEDKYSMFNIKVVGFTDSTSGGTIILPPQITTLAGLDFDIDKLFMMIPDFYIDKNGNPKYIKPLNSNSTNKEIADHIAKSFRETKKFIQKNVKDKEVAERLISLARKKAIKKGEISKLKLTEEETTKANLILARIENQKREILAETKNLERKESLQKTLDELYAELDDMSVEIYQKDIEELAKEIETIIKKEGLNYKELMSTSSRNNRIIEILRTILSSPQASKSILEPGSFDNLKEKAHYIRLKRSNNKKLIKKAEDLKSQFESNKINILELREGLLELINELEEEDFNINYPSTQIELFRRNMTGAELIGIFANQNVHHAKSQHIEDFGLTVPIFFNNVLFDSLTQERNYLGERISGGLASYLAAVVDNASDPIAAFLNMNTFTADLISTLTRVGVSEGTIFYFLNQDSILDLNNQYFLNRTNQREGQIIRDVKAKWFTKLIGSGLFTDEEISKIQGEIQDGIFHTDLTDEILDKGLSQSEENLQGAQLKEYLLNQYKALIAFTTYKKPSDELGNLVRASKVDTKAVGPTSGYTFALIDKQKKTSQRAQSENSSLYGVDSFFFEDGNQKLNPGFYKWGIVMPTDLMNKIFNNIGKEVNGEIEYNILGQLKSFFANMKDAEFDISDKEAYELDTMFMSFLASRLPFFHRKHAEPTMKELPDRLATFKINNPNSEYNIFLDSVYTKDATENIPFRTIQYYNTGKNSLDNDYVRRVWGNMIESTNPEARALAIDLIRYTYFSSGYTFSPFSFFHLVPVKFWTDSFAHKNEDIGLKNAKGQTFNDILEKALEEVNSSKTLYTDLILRFITQYAQNKAEKSTLLKNHNLEENFNRPYAPVKKVNELAEDEVMIFPGKQDVGFTLNNAPQGKGQVGYVRSRVAEESKQEALQKYADDIISIIELAKENPKKKFYFSKNALNGGFIDNKPIIDFKTARDILIAIHSEYNIPENVYFPQEKGKLTSPYEVRSNKSVTLSPKNPNYLIIKKSMAKHLEVFREDGSKDFVYVFTTTDKEGNITLWKKVTGEHKQAANTEYEIVYEKLPQLGNSIGLLEFDAFNDIIESIKPKIIKGAESNNSVLTDEDRMNLAIQSQIKPKEGPLNKTIEISDSKEGGVPITKEEEDAPKVTDIDDNAPSYGLGWASGKKAKTNSELSEQDFLSLDNLKRWATYAKEVEKIGETPLKFETFATLPDSEQFQMYKCKL